MTEATNTWLLYALGSMVLFSVSNVMLKQTISSSSLSKLSIQAILGIALTIIIAAAIIYELFLKPVIMSQSILLILGVVILSFFAVLLEIFALQNGEVALVNAILGLSTIGIAIISYIFLGDRFTYTEILAIILATASVLLLVF